MPKVEAPIFKSCFRFHVGRLRADAGSTLMPRDPSPDGFFCHPIAPACWHRDAVPNMRQKPYNETRPGDFVSFRELGAKEGLLRLIIGRIITADGHDMQDDYTVPIETYFLHKPLDWILRYTYCRARGIHERQAALQVRFMLAEAGAGLGWFDVSMSPHDLRLKDSDIVEVLVTRRADATLGEGCVATISDMTLETGTVEAMSWAPGSWQEAIGFIHETQRSFRSLGGNCWIPKAWTVLERYVEDDNVVIPALMLFLSFIQDAHLSLEQGSGQQLVRDRGCIKILQRILGVHSRNHAVQDLGWGILAILALDPVVQTFLVTRGGIRALALRCERGGELSGQSLMAVKQLLQSTAEVPRSPSVFTASRNPFASNDKAQKSPGAGPRTEGLSTADMHAIGP